ncbi:MAG: endolytic transglycosylase MltG [Vulcanimicrobiota bacterium]
MKYLKTVAVILVIALLLALVFALGVGVGFYSLLTPQKGEKVVIEIPKGATGAQVARQLEEKGAINQAFLFRVVMKLSDSGDEMKPGRYEVDPDKNMIQILEQLKKGGGELRLVSIPEGLTLKQVAQLLDEKGIVKKEEFLITAGEKPFEVNGKPPASLEGYLLPNTYDFPVYYDSEKTIQTMVDAFNEKAVFQYEKKKDSLPVSLSLHEVVTLASMVEREAQVEKERAKIANVYYNRLKKGMKMECDATVRYALEKFKDYLKYSDLRVDSPYNTYVYTGLPPGPIANPGLESIKATLNPENHNYYYYVRNDVKNDGSHIFSKTYAEHNAAIRKYQR